MHIRVDIYMNINWTNEGSKGAVAPLVGVQRATPLREAGSKGRQPLAGSKGQRQKAVNPKSRFIR